MDAEGEVHRGERRRRMPIRLSYYLSAKGSRIYKAYVRRVAWKVGRILKAVKM
jgi:hypothetical protein